MSSKPDRSAEQGGQKGGKLSRNLTVLSSAAVLAVYSAGYLRTRAAAEKFAADEAPRRPGAPAVPGAVASRGGGPAVDAAVQPAERPTTIAPVPPSSSSQPLTSSPPPARVPPVSSTTAPAAVPVDAPAAPVPEEEWPAAAAPLTASASAGVATAAPAAAEIQPAAAPAAMAAPAPAAPPPLAAPKYKDGSYTGWGTSRHGDIEATVTISGGKITSALISQCWTRYSCSWISPLPPQVPARQSAEVDYVSGATQSTYAFYYAVIEALSKAKN